MSHPILHTSQGIRKITLNTLPTEQYAPQWTACDRPSGISSLAATVLPAKAEFKSARIFIIEDSATVRKIVATTLMNAGYEIQAFPDGIAAMQWLAQPGAWLPDLLLVDLGLPKMDGYEVIRRIKAKPQFEHTRCIILSRRDGMVDRLKGRLAGAMTYLTKPFTMQALLAAVHTSLMR